MRCSPDEPLPWRATTRSRRRARPFRRDVHAPTNGSWRRSSAVPGRGEPRASDIDRRSRRRRRRRRRAGRTIVRRLAGPVPRATRTTTAFATGRRDAGAALRQRRRTIRSGRTSCVRPRRDLARIDSRRPRSTRRPRRAARQSCPGPGTPRRTSPRRSDGVARGRRSARNRGARDLTVEQGGRRDEPYGPSPTEQRLRIGRSRDDPTGTDARRTWPPGTARGGLVGDLARASSPARRWPPGGGGSADRQPVGDLSRRCGRVQLEPVVHETERALAVGAAHDARDPDRRRRDHLDVDALLGERVEHVGGDARVASSSPRRRARPSRCRRRP